MLLGAHVVPPDLAVDVIGRAPAGRQHGFVVHVGGVLVERRRHLAAGSFEQALEPISERRGGGGGEERRREEDEGRERRRIQYRRRVDVRRESFRERQEAPGFRPGPRGTGVRVCCITSCIRVNAHMGVRRRRKRIRRRSR